MLSSSAFWSFCIFVFLITHIDKKREESVVFRVRIYVNSYTDEVLKIMQSSIDNDYVFIIKNSGIFRKTFIGSIYL